MKLNVLAVLLAVMPSTAMAGIVRDSAWFSLEGSSDPSVTATGGPGLALVINKLVDVGTTVLTIGYNFTNARQSGNPIGMAAWGFTLDQIDLNGGTQSVTASNGDFSVSQAADYDLNLPGIDPSAELYSAGAQSSAANGTDGLVFTFEIFLIEKQDRVPTTTNIFGDLQTQVLDIGFAWYGSFGPNAGRYGIPGYNDRTGELPVITIPIVDPEPATLVLLGAGMVLLLRRRRERRWIG